MRKRQQRQRNPSFSAFTGGGDKTDEDGEEGVEVVPRDHREFPFSERDEYPKFSVMEAMAPSTKPPTKGKFPRRWCHGAVSGTLYLLLFCLFCEHVFCCIKSNR